MLNVKVKRKEIYRQSTRREASSPLYVSNQTSPHPVPTYIEYYISPNPPSRFLLYMRDPIAISCSRYIHNLSYSLQQ